MAWDDDIALGLEYEDAEEYNPKFNKLMYQAQIKNKEKKMNKPTVELIGTDGNAFAILGKVTRELRKAGFDSDYIQKYKEEAMAGDYDHLLQVTMKYVEII